MLKKKVISIILGLSLSIGVLTGCSTTQPTVQDKPAQNTSVKVYQGLGQIPAFRVGPGKDKKEVQVYSFTYLTANATFDKDGKIINIYFDSLEVSTPNYDGESMPHFSGWPGIQGYNITDHKSGEVSGISNNTNESIAAEVNGWKTKRERGDQYGMNYNNDWHKQADFYQNFFKGKTVNDIEQWFSKYCSDVNGRPLTTKSTNEKDKEKLAKLTDSEKKALADVTSGATMSLKDAHGDFISVIKKAYENRVEVTIPSN
ncbi:FMN-binding protein [Candidatus Clostridium radicumherbarum]|uniref:FMN-binding protein n=1 Tax=Candidatus Clostridium radicumherbarum TaxID=3381662 RepID=A0ABW8TNS2_9CLOT